MTDIDKRIFAAVVQGDKEAFERLFQKYYVMLCDYAWSYLNDADETEDAVQDVFVYVWNHRGEIHANGSVKAYLFASVKHRALNILKHRAVERSHSPLLVEFLEDLGREEYSEEEAFQLKQIRLAIEALPSQCRLVFMKSCLEGKKYKEIAEELHISVNTVKSHILKAYRSIHEYVGSSSSHSASFLFFALYSNLCLIRGKRM